MNEILNYFFGLHGVRAWGSLVLVNRFAAVGRSGPQRATIGRSWPRLEAVGLAYCTSGINYDGPVHDSSMHFSKHVGCAMVADLWTNCRNPCQSHALKKRPCRYFMPLRAYTDLVH